MIELTCLKELMLIKQVHRKSVVFVTAFLSWIIALSFNVCNRCRDLLMSLNLSDISILNIKVSDYCFINGLITKCEAINFMQNADLTKKGGTLQNIKKIIFIYKKWVKKY